MSKKTRKIVGWVMLILMVLSAIAGIVAYFLPS